MRPVGTTSGVADPVGASETEDRPEVRLNAPNIYPLNSPGCCFLYSVITLPFFS